MNIPFFVFVQEIGLETAVWVSSMCRCCGKSLLVRSCNLASSADGLVYRLRRSCALRFLSNPFLKRRAVFCCFCCLFTSGPERLSANIAVCKVCRTGCWIRLVCVCVCACGCVQWRWRGRRLTDRPTDRCPPFPVLVWRGIDTVASTPVREFGITKLPRHRECKIDHSPLSSVLLDGTWSFTSTPPRPVMAWCPIKRNDNFVSSLSVPSSFFFRRFQVFIWVQTLFLTFTWSVLVPLTTCRNSAPD